MDEQNNDFFAQLGLDSDPFPAEIDSSFYFENPDLLQRLDMIQHLIGFSNQMIFITGQQGVGKTSMLHRLEYYAPENWRICRIQANPMLNTPTLLRLLTDGFELEISADAGDMFQVYTEALQAYVQTLERAMLNPVVLIDNAHELPVDAFTMLFGFMQQEGSHSGMKMALFCEPQINVMLESPQLKSLSQNLTHQLEIPSFDEKQTRGYLEQRLMHAGLSKDFPFLSEVVHKIHRESGGIAGKIHILAQQALLDGSTQNEPPPLPVVDEIMDLEDDATPSAMSASKRAIEKVVPIGRKFQSWQIGVVAVVFVLLAAVLWLTSQFGDTTESMIAEEFPRDLKPEQEDNNIEEPEALNPSLFVETSSSEEVTTIEPETGTEKGQDLGAKETDFVRGETSLEELTQREVVEEIEVIVSPDVRKEEASKAEKNKTHAHEPGLKEEIVEPYRQFVEVLEVPDKKPEQPSETAHQQSEITVQIDENGKPQVVGIELSAAESLKIVEKLIENQVRKPTTRLPDVTTETAIINQKETPKEQALTAVIQPEPAIQEQAITKIPKKDVVATSTAIVEQQVEPLSTPFIGIKDGAWLRAQDDNLFVLQLLGTYDQLAMRKIINENQLGNVAWFTTLLNDEPWYVVVKGPFIDSSSATASAVSLPAEIRRRKPWPRTIASVKKAMDLIQ